MERSDKSGSGEDWWQASDGRWYPPGMAHHPAARAGAAGPGTQPAVDVSVGVDAARRPHQWRAWAVLLLPLLVILVLVLAVLDAASDPATVDAAGDGDPPGIGDPPGTAVSTTAPSTTTPPDLTMAPDPATTPRRPPPVPPVSATAPSTTAAAAPSTVVVGPDPSSAGTANVAGTPTSPDDCKHGGWRSLVDVDGRPFRNQGDCVSSVSSAG